jgi:hypothetical protein
MWSYKSVQHECRLCALLLSLLAGIVTGNVPSYALSYLPGSSVVTCSLT